MIVNSAGTPAPLSFTLNRPLQSESPPGSLFWLSNGLGAGAHTTISFGSTNIVGPCQQIISAAFDLVLIVAPAYILFCRRLKQVSLGRVSALVLLAILLCNKVFSPQYLLCLASSAVESPAGPGQTHLPGIVGWFTDPAYTPIAE